MSEHKERKTLEERQQMSDLERLRHSCAHVLATAICRLWPDAQLAGGPAVDNGFYYDVELDHRISKPLLNAVGKCKKTFFPKIQGMNAAGKPFPPAFGFFFRNASFPPFLFAFPRSPGLSALRQRPRQHSQRMIYTRSRLCHSGGQRS